MLVVQIAAAHSAKAWGILVRHSAGTALPKRTFVVSETAVRALRAARVKFSIISRNGSNGQVKEARARERV